MPASTFAPRFHVFTSATESDYDFTGTAIRLAATAYTHAWAKKLCLRLWVEAVQAGDRYADDFDVYVVDTRPER